MTKHYFSTMLGLIIVIVCFGIITFLNEYFPNIAAIFILIISYLLGRMLIGKRLDGYD